jgi:PIN domain nuclease of toxin-antitoxin system
MNYLVDTHILLWSFLETNKLSKEIKSILLDNDIYYSPINLWEISIKYRLEKLFLNGRTPDDFFSELNNSYYLCKDIDNKNLITNYKLPMYHRDPFDRFLIELFRNFSF